MEYEAPKYEKVACLNYRRDRGWPLGAGGGFRGMGGEGRREVIASKVRFTN